MEFVHTEVELMWNSFGDESSESRIQFLSIAVAVITLGHPKCKFSGVSKWQKDKALNIKCQDSGVFIRHSLCCDFVVGLLVLWLPLFSLNFLIWLLSLYWQFYSLIISVCLKLISHFSCLYQSTRSFHFLNISWVPGTLLNRMDKTANITFKILSFKRL